VDFFGLSAYCACAPEVTRLRRSHLSVKDPSSVVRLLKRPSSELKSRVQNMDTANTVRSYTYYVISNKIQNTQI
jgi:hypothetical protein